MTRVVLLVLLGMVATACGPRVDDPVMDIDGFDPVPCASERSGFECWRLTATAYGTQTGEGSCRIEATGQDRNLFVATQSEVLVLTPGRSIVWEVVVEVPDDPDFVAWNPVCDPAPEG